MVPDAHKIVRGVLAPCIFHRSAEGLINSYSLGVQLYYIVVHIQVVFRGLIIRVNIGHGDAAEHCVSDGIESAAFGLAIIIGNNLACKIKHIIITFQKAAFVISLR